MNHELRDIGIRQACNHKAWFFESSLKMEQIKTGSGKYINHNDAHRIITEHPESTAGLRREFDQAASRLDFDRMQELVRSLD